MSMTYILTASDHVPIAKGTLESPLTGKTLVLKIQDQKVEQVVEHEIILLFGSGKNDVPMQCRLLEQRGERVILEKLLVLNREMQNNLRIPVRFDSFIYPVSGDWKGRKPLRSIDLSCGGLAFYSDRGLAQGEVAEVVVPTSTNPLIVRMKILRRQELKSERTYYTAQFVNLHPDEEQMIREAVFSIQLQNRQRS